MPQLIDARRALHVIVLSCVAWLAASPAANAAEPFHGGYYRLPAVHDDTIIFVSEGSLWSVDRHGGEARRLTSAADTGSRPMISPDGQSVAFGARYEGPTEVYTMPVGGGLPQRRTWDGDALPAAWAPDGRLLLRTARYSTLPDSKLVLLDDRGAAEVVPLSEGAEAAYFNDGTLVFTRWRKQPSWTKRYQGGLAESLWRFDGHHEAVPLTADWAGTSHNPMVWERRLYFLSDRDGVQNVYSQDADGHDLRQESHQRGFDITSASLSDGHIIYACGADLWELDLKDGHETIIPITLSSDFDQLRDRWVKKPLDYVTSVHLAPDGSRAVFTARGQVFTLPAKSGRIVRVADKPGVRYREARFSADGRRIVVLSTESGETELWTYSADGLGVPDQLTHDAKVLRWEGIPSPDGRWVAHTDKDQQLWLYDLKARRDQRIAQSQSGDFTDLRWSPDSRWLAFVETAANTFLEIRVLDAENRTVQSITSDRYNSMSPAWGTDGKRLYFLSDRALETTVDSPWGARQPDPHFDRPVKIYEPERVNEFETKGLEYLTNLG